MSQKKECLVCHKSDNDIPLVKMEYRGEEIYICPQHIPLLIHEPEKLVGTLEGAENLKGV